MRRLCVLCLTIFFAGASHALAQEGLFFGKFSIGGEIGAWKPNALETESTLSPFGVSGASPYLGVFLLSPLSKSLMLRLTGGFWSRDEVHLLGTNSVTIYPVMLDLKYYLVPQFRLSPFVSYGGALYVGTEDQAHNLRALVSHRSELGLGANVGTGFDLQLARHFALGVEFRYHYAKFQHPLGETDDYSGPKISAAAFFLF